MKVLRSALEGLIVLVGSEPYSDARGTFRELWRASNYAEIGIEGPLVQDNVSVSAPDVLRGLHFQYERPQGKLVSVVAGRIFDVAVDIRPQSKTFGKWVGQELSDTNATQMWIPPGFAHGFYALEASVVIYKCSDYYQGAAEGALRWDDPRLGIEWPGKSPLVSEKDAAAPQLAELDLARLSSIVGL